MIKENAVVAINYTMTDEQGTVLDSSGNEPFQFLHGYQNIIPALERALAGLNVGDKKKVEIKPEDSFGPYDPELKFAMGLDQFGGQTPQPGHVIELTSPEGQSFRAQIVSVEESRVVLDANHPLAGKPVFFEVEVLNIRDASPEELSHGHPHGPGGHHH